jgi:cell division septation protein DedD
MNDILKRRLIGVLVLLALVFLLSWLLPDRWQDSGEQGISSTVLPLVPNGNDVQPSAPASASETEMQSPAAPHATPPPIAAASVAPASALPEAVDAVDSAAPPLPAAGSARTVPKPVAAPPSAVTAAAPKLAVKPTLTPPALKMAQSLPPARSPVQQAAASPKPAAVPPPAPPPPKLSSALIAPPAPILSSAAGQPRLWYVQIGSFSDQGNARTTQDLLQNIGYHGESSQANGPSGNTIYRVRLGPFPSEAVAQQALDKVSHQGYPQARVLSEPTAGKP